MVLNIVFMTLGIIALVESLIVLLFPKWGIRIVKGIAKNAKNLKKAMIVELIFGLILFFIGMNI